MLDLCCCLGFIQYGARGLFSSCGAWAYHCGGFSCCGAWVPGQGRSSCGAGAQVPHGMWDLPGLGIKPTSLALTGKLLATGPPGKSKAINFRS